MMSLAASDQSRASLPLDHLTGWTNGVAVRRQLAGSANQDTVVAECGCMTAT